ncbi:MAG: glutathione S-transferase family protein [bacterium]
MPKYVLYGGEFTRALITQMVMAEGGIDYELREIDIVNNQHRREAFLKINPAGWVPALVTPEGAVLYETPAINLYLADHHHLVHLAPATDDPDRGRFLSALFYLSGELEPAMKRYFYPHRYALEPEDSEAMKHKALTDALERLAVVNQRLNAGGPFHLGDRFSLVDLTLVYWAGCLEEDMTLEQYPAVRRCTQLTLGRPALRQLEDELRWLVTTYRQRQTAGEGVQ